MLKIAMPRVQDSIITLINIAAKNPEGEGVATGIVQVLDELKATDKAFREKLLVLQMAKEKGWKAAEKLQRRLNGEYENPHVAKVMEEEEKQKEKDKKEREKERSKPGPYRPRKSFPFRGNFRQMAPPMMMTGPGNFYSQPSPQFHPYQGFSQFRPTRQQASDEDKTCHRCGQLGHLIKYCPMRPK